MRGLLPVSTAHAWSQLNHIRPDTGHKIWPDIRHIPSINATGTVFLGEMTGVSDAGASSDGNATFRLGKS